MQDKVWVFNTKEDFTTTVMDMVYNSECPANIYIAFDRGMYGRPFNSRRVFMYSYIPQPKPFRLFRFLQSIFNYR